MKQSRELGMNLVLLGAEMRAGRTMSDALGSLADRLGLDEARSFAAMLRQSIELGTDVGTALRVFSDEMRERRKIAFAPAVSAALIGCFAGGCLAPAGSSGFCW